eukprot:COSAG04_NODE_2198_length_4550_cov_171.247360_2_plen_63_part_00
MSAFCFRLASVSPSEGLFSDFQSSVAKPLTVHVAGIPRGRFALEARFLQKETAPSMWVGSRA